jgi:hypothetical protein
VLRYYCEAFKYTTLSPTPPHQEAQAAQIADVAFSQRIFDQKTSEADQNWDLEPLPGIV